MYSSDNEVPTHACTVAWTSLTPLPGEGAPVANVRVGKARWRAAPHRGTNLKRTGTSSGWKRPMSGSIPARVSFPELAIMIVVFCLLWVLSFVYFGFFFACVCVYNPPPLCVMSGWIRSSFLSPSLFGQYLTLYHQAGHKLGILQIQKGFCREHGARH